MKLDATFDHSRSLTRRGFAGLLLLPAAALAQPNDWRDDDYRRRGDRGGYGGGYDGDYGGRYGGGRGYSRVWRAIPSDNFEPNRPDGRFDLRAYVDADAEFAIRGDEVTWRAFNGGAPRDAGCEFRKPIPQGELFGLRLDQRDGRSRIQVVDTPSPRNGWALVLRISDHKGGDDRYHARITWESDSAFGRGGYGWERDGYGRGPYGRDRY